MFPHHTAVNRDALSRVHKAAIQAGRDRRVGTPKRREIGHGRLAKRALVAVLPSQADFP